ncbi:hypothetical protein OEZ85_005110 [Tetradesmus obliquus]|uniref:Uncharacterized protein n=1 Tax=Tetradesmus obliquus TaxID=3088 RepID=A0ABY8UHB3_TETOB|nr:hypothetical protein OEZ85_005110 [Tetradesmus obliquus]
MTCVASASHGLTCGSCSRPTYVVNKLDEKLQLL